MLNQYLSKFRLTQVFDTPGLPTAHRAGDHVRDPRKLKSLLMTKEPSLVSVRLDEGGAVWFGGLARLDLERGPIERRFGLATLVVHTAGTRMNALRQHGFLDADAVALRDALLPEPDAHDDAL